MRLHKAAVANGAGELAAQDAGETSVSGRVSHMRSRLHCNGGLDGSDIGPVTSKP